MMIKSASRWPGSRARVSPRMENRSNQHRYRSVYSIPSKGPTSSDIPQKRDIRGRMWRVKRLGYNEFWTEVNRRSVSKTQYVAVKFLEELRGMCREITRWWKRWKGNDKGRQRRVIGERDLIYHNSIKCFVRFKRARTEIKKTESL